MCLFVCKLFFVLHWTYAFGPPTMRKGTHSWQKEKSQQQKQKVSTKLSIIFCRSNPIFIYVVLFAVPLIVVVGCLRPAHVFILVIANAIKTIIKTKKILQISRSLTRLSLSPCAAIPAAIAPASVDWTLPYGLSNCWPCASVLSSVLITPARGVFR